MRRGLRLPSLAGLHLVVAVPAVVLLVALVPPLQSPDETIHVCRAGQLSRGTPMSIVDAQGRAGNDVDVGLRWLAPQFLDILNGQRGTMITRGSEPRRPPSLRSSRRAPRS